MQIQTEQKVRLNLSLNLKSVASANKISHFNNFFVLRFWLISSLILRMFYFSICTDAVMHTILTHFLCFKSFYTLLLLKILTLSLVNFCNVHGTVLLWSGGSSVQNFIVSFFIVCRPKSVLQFLKLLLQNIYIIIP